MAEQSVAEEWLPPGWTAEIRVRKNGKKDRCYTDPSKERKFNSKPEVLRYLKSIESIPKSEGKRRSSRRNRPSLVSPAVPELENLEDNRTNGKKISNEIAELVETFKDEKILECTGGEETSLLDQKEKNEITNGVCNSAILCDSPPQNMLGVEENGNKRLEISNNNIKSKNNYKGTDLPRRASKRLAGVEVGPVPELSPNNRTRRVSARRVNDTDAAATSNNSLHVNNKDNLSTEISHEKCDDVACSTFEVPFKDFFMDPCIEFAIKTLTGEITIEDELGKNKEPIKVPEPSVESSFGDLWGDPCIEFAVKTLTGDIPFDDLNFQSYFKKREKGSDFSLASGSVSNSDCSLTSNFSQNGNGNNSFACRR